MNPKWKKATRSKKANGSALILATVLLFVVLSLVMSLSYVTVMEQKMSQKTKSSVGAFYNSESGVEWALNKIANNTGRVDSVPNLNWSSSDHYAGCPSALGGASICKIYFLDENGNVIVDGSTDISAVKAVRSVGAQTVGEPTQRAIEAAVAGVVQGTLCGWSTANAGTTNGATCEGHDPASASPPSSPSSPCPSGYHQVSIISLTVGPGSTDNLYSCAKD